MESLLFIASLVAFGVIVYWSIGNDGVPLHGRTRGLLAMDGAEPREDGSTAENTRRFTPKISAQKPDQSKAAPGSGPEAGRPATGRRDQPASARHPSTIRTRKSAPPR